MVRAPPISSSRPRSSPRSTTAGASRVADTPMRVRRAPPSCERRAPLRDPRGGWRVDAMVRVLTVDDQPVFREAARALVGMPPGFEVVAESADGETAVEIARTEHPDMVIVDERMTGID